MIVLKYLEQTTLTMISWAVSAGYPGLAVIMFLNTSLGFPPSELTCLFFGMAIAQGKLNIYYCILIASFFNIAGTSVLFYYALNRGRKDVTKIIDTINSKWYLVLLRYFGFSHTTINKVYRLFDHHDRLIVFAGRNVPLIRSVISLPAGICNMNKKAFFLFTSAGITFWISIWTCLGYYVGNDITSIEKYLVIIMAFIFSVILGKLLIRYPR